ncbi:MAG: SRPBCC family protein [Acidimicrobiales bacterium]
MDTPDATVDIDAEPAEVWESLTDPDGVEAWLGTDSRLDPIEGSDLAVTDPETATTRRGLVDHVDPHRRLVYTWWPDDPTDPTPATTVDIRLLPLHPGTRVIVTERPSVSATARVGAVSSAAGAWRWRLAALELRGVGVSVATIARR